MQSLMVLVHSPLVGPFTWSLVAKPLQADGFDVLVPHLTDSGETPPRYWQQHTESVQQERPLVLVCPIQASRNTRRAFSHAG